MGHLMLHLLATTSVIWKLNTIILSQMAVVLNDPCFTERKGIVKIRELFIGSTLGFGVLLF